MCVAFLLLQTCITKKEEYSDNTRPEVGIAQRETSPIIGLKNFNNWVKSVLISRFAHPALAASKVVTRGQRGTSRGKILDMGCGKGGDMNKWAKARVAEVLAVGWWPSSSSIALR